MTFVAEMTETPWKILEGRRWNPLLLDQRYVANIQTCVNGDSPIVTG